MNQTRAPQLDQQLVEIVLVDRLALGYDAAANWPVPVVQRQVEQRADGGHVEVERDAGQPVGPAGPVSDRARAHRADEQLGAGRQERVLLRLLGRQLCQVGDHISAFRRNVSGKR